MASHGATMIGRLTPLHPSATKRSRPDHPRRHLERELATTTATSDPVFFSAARLLTACLDRGLVAEAAGSDPTASSPALQPLTAEQLTTPRSIPVDGRRRGKPVPDRTDYVFHLTGARCPPLPPPRRGRADRAFTSEPPDRRPRHPLIGPGAGRGGGFTACSRSAWRPSCGATSIVLLGLAGLLALRPAPLRRRLNRRPVAQNRSFPSPAGRWWP